MEDLILSMVQTDLIWQEPEANRSLFEEKLLTLQVKPDIVLLPEMFCSGFTMDPAAVAETMDGESIYWMRKMAVSRDVAIAGSLVIEEQGSFFNRFIFVCPTGQIYQYDKKHLFTLAGEHLHYSAGSEKLMVEWKGWRIRPLVCYDLRFPVWSRNDDDYDLLLYVANWPTSRIKHWNRLLPSRAIENQSYVAAVNRIGKDPNGNNYCGCSAVFDYEGERIAHAGNVDGVLTVSLQRSNLVDFRRKLPFLNDRDHFKIL